MFFEKKIQKRGTSDHMAPSGMIPGLPCGRMRERASLWLAWGAGDVSQPPPIQTKKKTIKSIRVSGYKETKKRRKAKSKERVRKDLRAVKRKGKGKSEGQGK